VTGKLESSLKDSVLSKQIPNTIENNYYAQTELRLVSRTTSNKQLSIDPERQKSCC